MEWFTGSIPEAIRESRQKGLVFIVYIEGDNEETQKMNSSWAGSKIAETLSKERCVAIKLDHKSEDCSQFSKLYPVVCIPVTFFIGETGLPLEVVAGSPPVDEFIAKANKAFEAHQNSRTNKTRTPATSSEPQTNSAPSSSVQPSSVNATILEQSATPGSQNSTNRDIEAVSQTNSAPSSLVQPSSVNDTIQEQPATPGSQNSTSSDIEAVPQTNSAPSSLVQPSGNDTIQEQPATPASQGATSRDIEAVPGPSQEPTDNSFKETTLQERVERAKEIIEKKRLEKEENEKQDLKKKEFERRHVGQELAKAKRNREEKQAQDTMNQIKEDRVKERAHREAVRKQIAKDKAERVARRQNELQEKEHVQAGATPSAAVTGGSDKPAKSDCTSARLQFRLPDGSSITHTFPADSLLESVRQFIDRKLGPSSSLVTLYTTYPRRELTEEDLGRTLDDLGLAPSSTLIVAVNNLPGGSSSSELLVWILSPLFALINLLKAFLFGRPQQPRGAYHSTTTNREDLRSNLQQVNRTLQRRIRGGDSSVREEGGVHRLNNRNDDDDENNTWNGNSTQQM